MQIPGSNVTYPGTLNKVMKRESGLLSGVRQGYRNELDEYLIHREGGGRFIVRYEQDNDQWIAIAQIVFDETEIIKRHTKALNKKTAQNEVCIIERHRDNVVDLSER